MIWQGTVRRRPSWWSTVTTSVANHHHLPPTTSLENEPKQLVFEGGDCFHPHHLPRKRAKCLSRVVIVFSYHQLPPPATTPITRHNHTNNRLLRKRAYALVFVGGHYHDRCGADHLFTTTTTVTSSPRHINITHQCWHHHASVMSFFVFGIVLEPFGARKIHFV